MNIEKYVFEYKNGNQINFGEIYSNTYPIVRCAIYRYIQNRNVVEDLIQDVYTKVNLKISSYDSNNFYNWIYTMAKNVAIDYLKKKHEDRIENVDSVFDSSSHPYLNYALKHLDDSLREIFLMKVLYGHTTKRIAKILNLLPHEVNRIYNKAKEILRKCLEEDRYEA